MEGGKAVNRDGEKRKEEKGGPTGGKGKDTKVRKRKEEGRKEEGQGEESWQERRSAVKKV